MTPRAYCSAARQRGTDVPFSASRYKLPGIAVVTQFSAHGMVPAKHHRMSKKRAPRSYASKSTPATLRKQSRIVQILQQLHDGLTVAEVGKALGMSRQLALYHLKKMVAAGLITMVLEPCTENGGVRYRVWDELALAAHYSRLLHRTIQETATHAHAAAA
jgi:DNA-binding transcriptional ArsR family regulator